jgi:hypothetical protein
LTSLLKLARGLLCACVCLSALPAAAGSLDLDRLKPGCGGSAVDYWVARQVEDLRQPAIQWRGSENESCLVSSSVWRDGVASARVAPRGEAAGFALRYLDAERYIGVYVDLRAGLASAKEWNGDDGRVLASVAFDPPRRVRAPRVTAAAVGDRVVLYVEGRRVLDAKGATPRAGAVALLAAPLCEAEVDQAATLPLASEAAAFVEPLVLPDTVVGGEVDVTPVCHQPIRPEDEQRPCHWSAEGTLPSGIGLSAAGRLMGSPREAGIFGVRLTVVTAEWEYPTRQTLSLRVDGATWPRFPVDPATRRDRTLAVLYTPDDIGPNITWEKLGRPEGGLFRLHREHPNLRVTLMLCPENRYISPPAADARASAEKVWRDIVTDPNLSWLELGGHGYAHSPDDDVDLHHDEFSTEQSGCNVDHAALGERGYCERRFAQARASMRRAGIPDEALTVMRFPGLADSPEALRAAARDGYLAIFGSRHQQQAGRPWWTPLPDGGEVLEIQNVPVQRALLASEELEQGLENGSIDPATVRDSAPFREALDKGRTLLRRLEAQGGLVNLFDHWWENAKEVAGVRPREMLLDAWLRELPAERVWWPSSRALVSWIQLQRFARFSWRARKDRVEVVVEPPRPWRPPAEGLEVSLVVHVPGHAAVAEVLVDGDPLPRSRWWDDRGRVVLAFPLRDRTRLTLRTSGPPRPS